MWKHFTVVHNHVTHDSRFLFDVCDHFSERILVKEALRFNKASRTSSRKDEVWRELPRGMTHVFFLAKLLTNSLAQLTAFVKRV